MLIAGAGGHALEVLDVVVETIGKDKIAFFDDLREQTTVHEFFPVLKTAREVSDWFLKDPHFCLGVGKPEQREILNRKMISMGGQQIGLRSMKADISAFSELNNGCDILRQCFVSSKTRIGTGTLVNTGASVHHEVRVGEFCEIGPGAILLGQVSLGDHVSVGGGAIVLPGIEICSNAIIGAGAVVRKSITILGTYVGVPAVRIK